MLVNRLRPLPALMCVQRKAPKKIVTEPDAIKSNLDGFGDDIGKTTNWITSMFEVRARFPEDSIEHKTLDYRIKCGQLYQQNSIDKTKGILSNPMPKEWHDRHAVGRIEDSEKRALYQRIVADRKPYFMRYIYPALMRQYNTYTSNANKNALREFQMTIDELNAVPKEQLTERQREFLHYYWARMPVGTADCLMNRICRRFEQEFDGYLEKRRSNRSFDYSIMKSGAEYTQSQFDAILKLYNGYNQRLRSYAVYASYERIDEYNAFSEMLAMRSEFEQECARVCPNRFILCDIVLDICYRRSSTARFAWDMCADEIIENLLARNGGQIEYPELDENGDIYFGGNRFFMREIEIGGYE